MTGQQLLEALQALTPEQLAKEVYTDKHGEWYTLYELNVDKVSDTVLHFD